MGTLPKTMPAALVVEVDGEMGTLVKKKPGVEVDGEMGTLVKKKPGVEVDGVSALMG